MDAEAVSAALTAAALSPPIAKRLGLPTAKVEAALSLLAEGSQPAFVARYRSAAIDGLQLADVERIQARAAAAVAFEFKRQHALAELATKGFDAPHLVRHAQRATSLLELDDLAVLWRRKKRGPALDAKLQGLMPAALALWKHGSTGVFSDAANLPEKLLAIPKPPKPSKRSRSKRSRKGDAPPVEATATDAAPVEAASAETTQSAPEASDASAPTVAAVVAVDEATQTAANAETVVVGPPTSATAAPAEAAPAEGDPTDEASAEAAPAEASPSVAPEAVAAPEAEAAPGSSSPAEANDKSEAPAAEPTTEAGPSFDPAEVAAAISADGVGDDEAGLRGARSICGEFLGEHPSLRLRLRKLLVQRGRMQTNVVEAKKDKASRYTKFFDRNEACSSLAPTTVLAIHRAEREGLLKVEVEIEGELVLEAVATELKVDRESPAGQQLMTAVAEAWKHGLGRAIKNGARKIIKERADGAAIKDYCEALRPLLLSPAFGDEPVLAIDPGQQHGCRLVVLDATGKMVADDTVFPLQPKLQAPQAKARIAELCTQFSVKLIAVENGTSGREVERLCREVVAETEAIDAIPIVSVDADAAGVHASSKAGKEEFPKSEASLRRAVAAGRRVQNPLRELSKLDPRKLGLGPHQYEVEQEELRAALEQVVGSCLAEVGLDVNAASADRLARLPGMSHALAKAMVSTREAKSQFRSRAELLEVPGFAGKAFEQAVGFLFVRDGEQPLDATRVHPERYAQVTQMARDLGVTVGDLVGNAETVAKIDGSKYIGTPAVSGALLTEQALAALRSFLAKPQADPRPPFVTAAVHPDLVTFDDLKVGMELEGIVTHLANFGAFVDVGIAQEALAHVSELSHDFINNPLEAVHVGQKVRGRVIEVSPEKKRFSISLKALLPKPDRPARPGRSEGRGKPRKGGKPTGKGGKSRGRDGKDRGGKDRGGKPKPKDKVLGFRMDLSDLANLIDKS